jgi:cobalt/nickel transport system permease protein
MHMADALISPAVGGTFWAATTVTITYCAKKVQRDLDDRKIPLMGVLGAFIFAAQMINFSIPGTGSSGHLGGGMILAILLGPYAAFLTIASVLTVQALFFADGGLLALGCNIFNLGFFPCFFAYPLTFKPFVGNNPTPQKLGLGATLSAIVGLQLGALAVVLETVASGISELPFATFLAAMQPIHLAIGLVEGAVTTLVVTFIWRARPEILELIQKEKPFATLPLGKIVTVFALITVMTGGILSWYASSAPDGLEWSTAKVTGKEELAAPESGLHATLAALQEKLAFLPDYGFKPEKKESHAMPEPSSDKVVDIGKTTSGLVGGLLTLAITVAAGFLLYRRRQPA